MILSLDAQLAVCTLRGEELPRLGACLSYVSQQGFLATELNKNATAACPEAQGISFP